MSTDEDWWAVNCDPDCDERAACDKTGVGHLSCGVCADHGTPRHHCGCLVLDFAAGVGGADQ